MIHQNFCSIYYLCDKSFSTFFMISGFWWIFFFLMEIVNFLFIFRDEENWIFIKFTNKKEIIRMVSTRTTIYNSSSSTNHQSEISIDNIIGGTRKRNMIDYKTLNSNGNNNFTSTLKTSSKSHNTLEMRNRQFKF